MNAYDRIVTWQPSFDATPWPDDDYEFPLFPPAKLSKKERKRLKKNRKRARKAAAARLDERRQVLLEDIGHERNLRLIFTDFDGVLNQHSSGKYELLPAQVERLDRLARETDAVVIVSSWWRKIGVERLRADLAEAGFGGRLVGRTPWLGDDEMWDAYERGTEIAAVLTYLGDRVESYVILDDHARMGDLLPNLVQTVATEGLTEADVRAARRILTAVPRHEVA